MRATERKSGPAKSDPISYSVTFINLVYNLMANIIIDQEPGEMAWMENGYHDIW